MGAFSRPARAGFWMTRLPAASCAVFKPWREATSSTYCRAAASFVEARGMAAKAAKCFQTAFGSRFSKTEVMRLPPRKSAPAILLGRARLLQPLCLRRFRPERANRENTGWNIFTEYPHESLGRHRDRSRQRPVSVWRTPALRYSVPARYGRFSIYHAGHRRDARSRHREFSPNGGRRAACRRENSLKKQPSEFLPLPDVNIPPPEPVHEEC